MIYRPAERTVMALVPGRTPVNGVPDKDGVTRNRPCTLRFGWAANHPHEVQIQFEQSLWVVDRDVLSIAVEKGSDGPLGISNGLVQMHRLQDALAFALISPAGDVTMVAASTERVRIFFQATCAVTPMGEEPAHDIDAEWAALNENLS